MTHLDEATIVAIRDGESVSSHAHRHVEACPVCAGALGEARDRAEAVRTALTALDRPIDDFEPFREAAAARLGRTSPVHRGYARRLTLGRAAALLILTAGSLYALPGSPLRSSRFSSESDLPRATVTPTTSTVTPTPERVEAPVGAGGMAVDVHEPTESTTLEVVWIDADEVRVTAASGSTFLVGATRIDVHPRDGAIVVELPRMSAGVSLRVDGRALLRVEASGPEVFVEPERIDAAGILFGPPPR